MTKQFVKKNIALTLEFEDYLAKHPELYDSIPNGAFIVFTIKSDKKFSSENIAIVEKHARKEPIIKAEKVQSRWTLSPLELKPV
jgi:hypothetical protein